MERTDRIDLTAAEWKVMEQLWANGPQTGRAVAEAMRERFGWSRSTALTHLGRMDGKGAVAPELGTGPKRYRPCIGRDAAALQETETFLERVYHGSVRTMVSALTRQQALSAEEVEELYALLKEIQEGGEQG